MKPSMLTLRKKKNRVFLVDQNKVIEYGNRRIYHFE